MLFRQLFDKTSSTYTYLLASRRGGEALLIDPVLGRVDTAVLAWRNDRSGSMAEGPRPCHRNAPHAAAGQSGSNG